MPGNGELADKVLLIAGVVYLLSDRASITTGQIIHLDGGVLARASWPTNAAPYEPPLVRAQNNWTDTRHQERDS